MALANGCLKPNMSDWKINSIKKRGKGSHTPGKAKGEKCMASVVDKYMAKRSRSYKDKDYSKWCAKYDKLNGVKR